MEWITFRLLLTNEVLNHRFAGYLCATGLPAVCIGAFLAPTIPEDTAKLGLGILNTSLAIFNLILKDRKTERVSLKSQRKTSFFGL